MDRVDYVNTFIAVAPDNRAMRGLKPPSRILTVAALTYELINGHPYELTSGDVIFTVMALRRGISDADRAAARVDFYAKPRPCLRSSDLGKRYGWGIHADAEGRLALYGVESHEYGRLLDGRDPFGEWVAVTRAMRSSR